MISVFVACSSQSTDNSFEARGYSSTDKLVSAEWLEENINDVKKPRQARRSAASARSTAKNQTGRYTVSPKQNKPRDNSSRFDD